MTSQKLCEHVGQTASCANREAYKWRGSTVFDFTATVVRAFLLV